MVTNSGIRAFDAMLKKEKPQRPRVVADLMPMKARTRSFVVGIPHTGVRV